MRVNIHLRITYSLLLLSCSCVLNQSLESYALEVKESTRPGVYTLNYLNSIPNKSPEQELAFAYYDLSNKWCYKKDKLENDHFENAELMFKRGVFIGDCEDFAAIMFTICRLRHFKSKICLAENRSKSSGHAWVEVELCSENKYFGEFKEKILASFSSNVTIYSRDSVMYLAFISEEEINEYQVTNYIDTSGIVSTCFKRASL